MAVIDHIDAHPQARVRKVQQMWPRIPASVLWKIGRVASSAFAALMASPRLQIALAQHNLESSDFGVGAARTGRAGA